MKTIESHQYVEKLRFCSDCANHDQSETSAPCRECILTPGRPAYESKEPADG